MDFSLMLVDLFLRCFISIGLSIEFLATDKNTFYVFICTKSFCWLRRNDEGLFSAQWLLLIFCLSLFGFSFNRSF